MKSIKAIFKNTSAFTFYRKRRDKKIWHSGWSDRDERLKLFYSEFIKPGDLVFDVGANVGNRIKIFLELGARVIAIEPQNYCVDFLQELYGTHPNVEIVPKAMGRINGQMEMLVSSAHTISTLSHKWKNAVSTSGRFAEDAWDKRETVQVATLDQMIAEFGIPVFAKIDVEGFEDQVVAGLSNIIPCISLEFIPEHMDCIFNCVNHLQSFCDCTINYSLDESMVFEHDQWESAEKIGDRLSMYKNNREIVGDVYVKMRESR